MTTSNDKTNTKILLNGKLSDYPMQHMVIFPGTHNDQIAMGAGLTLAHCKHCRPDFEPKLDRPACAVLAVMSWAMNQYKDAHCGHLLTQCDYYHKISSSDEGI